MSSDRRWSLTVFDAPMDVILPWVAGTYLANDRFFRAVAPFRRWMTPQPRTRRDPR